MIDYKNYAGIINTYEWYLKFFEEAINRSIPTFINGAELVTFSKIEVLCLMLVRESYMQDYILDEMGNVISICLDRVTAC